VLRARAEAEVHQFRPAHRVGTCHGDLMDHKIRGLHRNDFIMAAKTDGLAAESGYHA
jgi:pterin-4a-carbinolamine dehydratase